MNGKVVAEWEAIRTGQFGLADDPHYQYRCAVTRYNEPGDTEAGGDVLAFGVDHRYADGAIVLAPKVLAAYHRSDEA